MVDVRNSKDASIYDSISSDKPGKADTSVSFERLVHNNYESVFLIVNIYIQNFRTSMELVEQIFNAAQKRRVRKRETLYKLCVGELLHHREFSYEHPEIALEDSLCLFLREFTLMNYQQISKVLEVSKEEVGQKIAKTRHCLVRYAA